jgi:hypothetical protein
VIRDKLARMKRFVLACVLAAGVAVSGVANAQDDAASAEARTQYGLGTQAFQAKKYAEAATHFEAAAAARSNAVALYTAGLAWDLAGKQERAADAFSRALDVPGLDPKQATNAKEKVATYEKTLGTVAVQGPDGSKVQLDSLTEAPVPARLHALPGAHSITVKVPGKPVDHRDVLLEAGKVVEVSLKDEPPKPPITTTPEPAPTETPKETAPVHSSHESYWTIRRVAGVGVAGLGVAVLGAGAVLGINANGAKDAYDASPSREAFDHASSLETWTNVAFITGAVCLVGGIVLVVLPDDDGHEGRMKLGIGPRGATLGGTF